MTILVTAHDVISEVLTQFNRCIKCKVVCWEKKNAITKCNFIYVLHSLWIHFYGMKKIEFRDRWWKLSLKIRCWILTEDLWNCCFSFLQSESSPVQAVIRPCPDPSENMLIVTCPFTAVLIPAILKHKDENRYEARNRTKWSRLTISLLTEVKTQLCSVRNFSCMEKYVLQQAHFKVIF